MNLEALQSATKKRWEKKKSINKKKAMEKIYRPKKKRISQAKLERITEIKEYIDANIKEAYSVSGLANKFGGTHFDLNLHFKKVYGVSAYEYITRKKLEKAKQMLLRTSEPIKRIAYEIGYGTRQSFLNFFSKKVGTTPGKYRLGNQSSLPFEESLDIGWVQISEGKELPEYDELVLWFREDGFIKQDSLDKDRDNQWIFQNEGFGIYTHYRRLDPPVNIHKALAFDNL